MDCREARCIIQNKRKSWGFWKPSRNLPQEDKFQSLANLKYHNSASATPVQEPTACEWQSVHRSAILFRNGLGWLVEQAPPPASIQQRKKSRRGRDRPASSLCICHSPAVSSRLFHCAVAWYKGENTSGYYHDMMANDGACSLRPIQARCIPMRRYVSFAIDENTDTCNEKCAANSRNQSLNQPSNNLMRPTLITTRPELNALYKQSSSTVPGMCAYPSVEASWVIWDRKGNLIV
ncbi:hypothetical protein QR685DRAFT_572828 [Neurospora intermedia]|uniref:Uncharacterized protein n=1 Tax=Neurospora intermedia TaxID=5142 RepID=A0ABR3DB54_NEUIN